MAVMARHVGEGGFTAVEAQFTGGRCGPLMKPTRTLSQEVAVVSPRSSVRRLNAPAAAAAAPPTQQIPGYSSSTTKFVQQQRSSKLLDSAMEKKAQTWVAATELDSDLLVKVADMSFHLHKFPLLSRSGRLNRLVFESRDTEKDCINMDDMPGGAVAFELAAKFCYGITVKITARNVAALRCAAEYLEMTEEYEKDNLVTRTEAFLTSEVLASWKKSIAVLQTCVKLLPWAKELQIVKRCIESVAWKACTDPRGIRWSYSSSSCSCYSCSSCVLAASPASTTSSSSTQWSSAVSCKQIPQDWWFQDISSLSLESFGYVMDAIRVKGMRPELIGSAIVYYAHEWLPDLHRMSASPSSKHGSPTSSRLDSPPPLPLHTSKFGVSRGLGLELGGSKELKKLPPAERNNRDLKQNCRMILDALVRMLPCQADAISCSAALRLLRAASLLNASQETMKELERRAGMQLENANLSDLLIPSFLHTSDTLYDTDIVQRILEQFLVQTGLDEVGGVQEHTGANKVKEAPSNCPIGKPPVAPHTAKMKVAKLIDSYLAEVARDSQLLCAKFQALAEALPDFSRVTDDGLYRAIDIYLKAHPGISEQERKRLCRMMDCQRLSLEACMHAAENERLPLRVVIQVLFSEQLKLRNAIMGGNFTRGHQPSDSPLKQESMGASQQVTLLGQSVHENSSTQMDIKALQQDVMFMKAKFLELHQDYSAVTQQLEKLTKQKAHQSSWVSGLKRLSHVFHHKEPSASASPLQMRSSRPWRNSIS